MKKQKLMILGGSRYILPVIKTAQALGAYVITADYLPNNYAHRYSDEYVNVSIVDEDAVLKVASAKGIDGIMSFACDPGVTTAAYVAEKLHLPSVGPYESVCILQNKGKFRQFLARHGFNVPTAKSFTSIDCALEEMEMFHWPVIVKPTDSAGSKGVTKVESPDKLRISIEHALAFSRSKEFIIEDFLQQKGYSSDSDSFSVDGEMKFISYNSQRFDTNAANPYTPAAYSWPSTISVEHQKELSSEIQRLIHLLGLKTSIYNIEVRECTDGKAYIMECSPRGGGNRLCEMIRYATGVDMITAMTCYSIGKPIPKIEQKPYNGHWAEVILHANEEGVFDHVELSPELPAEVVEEDLWVKKGEHVNSFKGANAAIGTLVLKFEKEKEMAKAISDISSWLKIIVH